MLSVSANSQAAFSTVSGSAYMRQRGPRSLPSRLPTASAIK